MTRNQFEAGIVFYSDSVGGRGPLILYLSHPLVEKRVAIPAKGLTSSLRIRPGETTIQAAKRFAIDQAMRYWEVAGLLPPFYDPAQLKPVAVSEMFPIEQELMLYG